MVHFIFIDLIVSLLPLPFLAVVFLLRRPVREGWVFVKYPLGILSVGLDLGIIYDVLQTTNFSGDILFVRVTNSQTGWHVLTVFGIVGTALIVGAYRRDFFFGAMTAWFAAGVHEVLWFVFIWIEALLRGDVSWIVQYLTNPANWLYWSIVFPIVPFYLWLYKPKGRAIAYGLIPLVVFFQGWLIPGFPVSTFTPWNGLAFYFSDLVAIIEIGSWYVAFGAATTVSEGVEVLDGKTK